MSHPWKLQAFGTSSYSPIVTIWNAACGADLRISERFVQFNTRPSLGSVQEGRIVIQEGNAVGFILASALPNDPLTSAPEVGWIDAMAVLPSAQRRGLGSELLAWGEQWLTEQGCTAVRLGGSLRPFVAGYPTELGHVDFFSRRGFRERENGAVVWDVARDLTDYVPESTPIDGVIRPAELGDQDALLRFLMREFPNRWRYQYLEFLRMNGRIADWMILLTERGIDGFAHLTFQDSVQPYERFYPYRLPQHWGQLGPIGVSQRVRGRGYGRQLLSTALSHLRERGVRGAVIDWTHLLDFYARFGFSPYRQYTILIKRLQ